MHQFFGIQEAIASIISTTICMVISFLINRKWTFDSTNGNVKLQMISYFAVSIISGWVVQPLVLMGTSGIWSAILPNFPFVYIVDNPVLIFAKLTGIFVATITNFIGYNYVVFREKL